MKVIPEVDQRKSTHTIDWFESALGTPEEKKVIEYIRRASPLDYLPNDSPKCGEKSHPGKSRGDNIQNKLEEDIFLTFAILEDFRCRYHILSTAPSNTIMCEIVAIDDIIPTILPQLNVLSQEFREIWKDNLDRIRPERFPNMLIYNYMINEQRGYKTYTNVDTAIQRIIRILEQIRIVVLWERTELERHLLETVEKKSNVEFIMNMRYEIWQDAEDRLNWESDIMKTPSCFANW